MRQTFKEFLTEAARDVSSLDDKWSRKPHDWSDAETVSHELNAHEAQKIGFDPQKFETYHVENIYDVDHEHRLPMPGDRMEDVPREDIFILEVPGHGEFLVKRSGHNYVRYAIKLL